MRIFNFGNDYVNERNLQNIEKELDNVSDSNATSPLQGGAEEEEGKEEPAAQTNSKADRKKEKAKEKEAGTSK